MSELALKLISENKAKHDRGEDASELNLENCGLDKFPFIIKNAHWLRKLNLSNNQSLKDLTGIETLNELNFVNIAYTGVSHISVLNNLDNINQLAQGLPQLRWFNVSRLESDISLSLTGAGMTIGFLRRRRNDSRNKSKQLLSSAGDHSPYQN